MMLKCLGSFDLSIPGYKNLFSLLLLTLLLTITGSCKKVVELEFPIPIDSSMIGKIKSVVILGNSIVRAGPNPGIGWYSDWGMDASSIDHDFVHILIHNMQAKDSHIIVRLRNIADFETNFVSFNLSSVDSMRNADLIIMKISENVDPNGPDYNRFITYYDQLIGYLDPENKAVRLIVDGFWDRAVNDKIRAYALDKKYPCISITDLSASAHNKGLIGHPSDIGMSLIATRIWNYVGYYF